MSLRTIFTDSEWETLEKTPLWAFILTAASDGNVDQQELEAFAKELAETMQYNDALAREVFVSLVSRLNELLPSCLQGPEEIIAGLQAAGRIVDTKCPDNAEPFKRSVLLICNNVAEASGPALGSKVSQEEQTAIVVIASALGLKLS